MSLSWPAKDPDAILDYDLDWSSWLGDDTIATSTWLLDAGALTISSNSKTDTATKVWLSGGELGKTYSLTNRITTAGGRTQDQTVTLKIRAR